MSETGEKQHPREVQEPPRQLEDMPEFQKLSKEQQEKLLTLRERMMSEAREPQQVVSRSIDEMGFWEGLKETVRPHMAEKKKIAVGKLKAYGSMAFSLIPVLGEGLAFGKGLFGITRTTAEAGKAAKTVFEPAIRLHKAKNAIMPAVYKVQTWGEIRQLDKVGKDAKFLTKAADAIGRAAEWTTRPFRMVFEGGSASIRVLNTEYAKHAEKAALKMIGANGAKEIHTMRVQAQEAARLAQESFVAGKVAEAAKAGKDLTSTRWWELRKKWQRFGIERGGKAEAARVLRQSKRGIDMMLEARKAGSGAGVVATEAYKITEKVKPTVLEGLGLKKYLALFDKWFNLTPDVPHWLSTTTGIAEFLGVHGIDAIPGIIQASMLKVREVGIDARMGKDVLAYAKKRLFEQKPERKAAAEVFATPAPVGAA